MTTYQHLEIRLFMLRLFLLGLLLMSQIPSGAFGAVLFSSGVASGDVTTTGAVLWTRVDQAAEMIAQIALDQDFQQITQLLPVEAIPERDFTVKVEVNNLQPATNYFYRFVFDDPISPQQISPMGTFRTAPPADRSVNVRFVYSGDSEAAFQPFEVLRAARNEQPDFFVYLGDTIYADKNSSAGNITRVDPQESLPIYRAKYQENRADQFLQDLLAATAVYAIWDDHEVINNFAGETVDPTLLANGLQAFLEYMPVREDPSEPNRLFRRFRWGKDVELFILDERQYRSAERFCFTRTGRLVLIPILQDPLCLLTELAAPDRTFLGSEQEFWLKFHLLSSDATFKFIINEVPISQLFVLPYGRWEGYLAARESLLQFIRNWRIRNVIFLTTDFHITLILNVKPFLSDKAVATEFVVGPIGTMLPVPPDPEELHRSFERLAKRLNLERPVCVNINTFSYALVEMNSQVQPKEVTITSKDASGNPVRDAVDPSRECRITIQAEE